MWVIKRPLKELESKPWPEYRSKELLTEETRNSVLYLTHYKLNDQVK